MSYRVLLTPQAETALLSLQPDLRRTELLKENPFPHGKAIKRLEAKMRTGQPLYRLRSGDYRILYLLEKERVVILAVVHRKELEDAISWLTGQR